MEGDRSGGAHAERRPLRLPLQTGAGALRDLLAAGLLGTFLILVTSALMGAMSAAVLQLEVSLAIACWVISGVLGVQALRTFAGGLSSARTHRASDLVATADGIRIVGGRRDGLTASWSRIDGPRCSVEPAISGKGLTFLGGAKYRQALFLVVDGEPVTVAESADEAEDHALDAAFATVRKGCGFSDEGARPRGPARGVTCPGCGAPAMIDDVPSLACAYCHRPVTVPEEVRLRVREARQRDAVTARVEQSVQRLLEQPGADRTNLVILVAGVAAVVAVVWMVGATVLATFGSRAALAPAGAAAATTCGLILTAYAHVADRRGLRSLTLGFAAREGAAGVECRRCAGPLPPHRTTDGRPPLVVRCVYCAADNVLAPGVADGLAAVRSADVELRDALRSTARTKALLRGAAFLCFGVAVLLVVLIAVSLK